MTRWQSVYRWTGAVLAVGVLAIVWYFTLGRSLDGSKASSGEAQRRINVVVDLGDDGARSCEYPEIERGAPVPVGALRADSTACVLVGTGDDDGTLRWFFFGRADGNGTVRVPRPANVGLTSVALANGAVVPIGGSVRVRCTADPNARFETFVADGSATAGYLDTSGALVAIDCELPE